MGSRLCLIMKDDLENLIRKMAAESDRTPCQQIMHLVDLGLKYQGKEIKDTATIPEGWQIVTSEQEVTK